MSAAAVSASASSSPTPLEQATEALNKASAKVTAAVAELDVIEKAFEPAATYDFRVAKAKVRVAEAKVREAEAKVRVAEAELARTKSQLEPAATYDVRLAEAKAGLAEAKADLAKAEYQVKEAEVEALLVENPPGPGDVRLKQVIEAKDVALDMAKAARKVWEDARTAHVEAAKAAAGKAP